MKNKIITGTFLILLSFIFIINIVTPKKELSYSERRKLTQFPELSASSIFDGEFMEEFEKYTLDQFAFRDNFRSFKAFFDLVLLNKSDNNDIYVINNNVFKMEYPLDINSVYNMSEKMNKIYDLYLKNMNVFYSIIPDKNYFVAKKNEYLAIDYSELEKIMNDNVKNMTYIDIMDCLQLNDYYRTDTHWKQESLGKVVKTISNKMAFKIDLKNIIYTEKTYHPFYGVYYGQSALNIEPYLLTYKTSENIQNAIVHNLENPIGEDAASLIYDEQMLGKMDSYNVFLSGGTPLITIENSNNKTGKELIIFRDSFASSLAPLLIEEYSKITLIDLRYIGYESIDDFVKFDDQDVLFLYSTLIINNSNILK